MKFWPNAPKPRSGQLRLKSAKASNEQGRRLGEDLAGEVFINCPYDQLFALFMVAYIAAISSHGLRPRAACEIAGPPRLDRIFRLISECRISFHDFSRFGDRFNVPFEFGIAFGLSLLDEHICFGFASSQRKIDKVLSDMRGVDLHIHRGSRKILFREIANVLVGGAARPTIAEMEGVYQGLVEALPRFEKETGSKSVFGPRIFKELVTLARSLSDGIIKTKQ